MSRLEEILKFNENFVENKEYEVYETSKQPNKQVLILSCMDTRLTDLLPKALNLKNGDAKIVKNAGASIMHAFGSVIRSIVVAVYEFDVKEILVIGHHNCGMCNLKPDDLITKIRERGISEDIINTLINAGIDINKWLHGFDSVEDSVKDSVNTIKNHPLIPKDLIVHGLVIDPKTGKLDVVVKGD